MDGATDASAAAQWARELGGGGGAGAEGGCAHHDIFSLAPLLEARIVYISFVALVAITIAIEYAIGSLERAVESYEHYAAMLAKVFKELMILGLISFSIFITEAAMDVNETYLYAFEFAHLVLFFTALGYVLQSFIFVATLTISRDKDIELESVDETQLLRRLRKFNGFAPAFYFTSLYTELRYFLFRHIFITQHKLPETLPFHEYLHRAMLEEIVDLLEIEPSTYLIVSAVGAAFAGGAHAIDEAAHKEDYGTPVTSRESRWPPDIAMMVAAACFILVLDLVLVYVCNLAALRVMAFCACGHNRYERFTMARLIEAVETLRRRKPSMRIAERLRLGPEAARGTPGTGRRSPEGGRSDGADALSVASSSSSDDDGAEAITIRASGPLSVQVRSASEPITPTSAMQGEAGVRVLQASSETSSAAEEEEKAAAPSSLPRLVAARSTPTGAMARGLSFQLKRLVNFQNRNSGSLEEPRDSIASSASQALPHHHSLPFHHGKHAHSGEDRKGERRGNLLEAASRSPKEEDVYLFDNIDISTVFPCKSESLVKKLLEVSMLAKCIFFALIICDTWYRIDHWRVEDEGVEARRRLGGGGGGDDEEGVHTPQMKFPVFLMVTLIPILAATVITPAAFRNFSVLSAISKINPQLLSDIIQELMADTRVLRTELATRVREVVGSRGEAGLRAVFDTFDTDGDGDITHRELYIGLIGLRMDYTRRQAKSLHGLFNRTGTMEFKDFKELVYPREQHWSVEDNIISRSDPFSLQVDPFSMQSPLANPLQAMRTRFTSMRLPLMSRASRNDMAMAAAAAAAAATRSHSSELPRGSDGGWPPSQV